MAKVPVAPFKKLLIGGKWDDVYLLPPLAFKLWFYYWRLEGKTREGWAPRLRIADKLRMNKDTVTDWREYLVKHGWLELVGYHKAKGANEGAKGIPIMRAKHGVVPTITRANRGWKNLAVTGAAIHGKSVIPVTGAASRGATIVASHGSTGAASHDVDIEHIKQKPNHVDGGFEIFSVETSESARPCFRGARLGESGNSTDTSKGSPSATVSSHVNKCSVHRASDLVKQMGLKIPVPKYQPSQCDGMNGRCLIPVLNGERFCKQHEKDSDWICEIEKGGILGEI
jgi:hypothetical protein